MRLAYSAAFKVHSRFTQGKLCSVRAQDGLVYEGFYVGMRPGSDAAILLKFPCILRSVSEMDATPACFQIGKGDVHRAHAVRRRSAHCREVRAVYHPRYF